MTSDDELEALTSSHLLYGYRLNAFPEVVLADEWNEGTYASRVWLKNFSLNLSSRFRAIW